MKTEYGSDDSEDDLVVLTPLDELITHKPTEQKFDTLSGMIPFEKNVRHSLSSN